MTVQQRPSEPVQVPCEICLKEVPTSEATVAEATDYVVYFCGLECYEKWRSQGAPAPAPDQSDKA